MLMTTLKDIYGLHVSLQFSEAIMSKLWDKSSDKLPSMFDPFPFIDIARNNGVDVAFICLRTLGDWYCHHLVMLACDLAEHSLRHAKMNDEKLKVALDVRRALAQGIPSPTEINASLSSIYDDVSAALEDACNRFDQIDTTSATYDQINSVRAVEARYFSARAVLTACSPGFNASDVSRVASDAASAAYENPSHEREWQLARFIMWCHEL